MASPSRRPESSQLQFRKKVPADLKGRVEGRRVVVEFPACAGHEAVLLAMRIGAGEIKASLRTTEKGVARLRTAAANAAVEKFFDGLRKGPSPLSHRQVVALSGEVYAALVARWQDDPGSEETWASWKGWSRAVMQGRVGAAPTATIGDAEDVGRAVERFGRDLTVGIDALPPGEPLDEALEGRFGFLADFSLARHGLMVDAATRSMLLKEIGKASIDAGWMLKRASQSDYSTDPQASRFPVFQAASKGVTLTSLFDAWRNETKPSPNTVMTWGGCFRQLREFLGHDDASRLTESNVIFWKDSLLAGDRKPKTVNDSHLTALRSVLAHAVRNKTLASNPATGVRAAVKAVAGEGALPYDDNEVARLLDIASRESNTYKRWLPMLAAATGARVGELAQLHAEHVVEIDGIACIRIEPTSDGGRVKNVASERIVPLHPYVIEAGFLTMVRERGPGPIFYKRSSRDEAKRHASKGVANHLGSWIREQGFNDPRKAPAHGLRHWFKTTCFRHGIQDSIADALQGHAPQSVASRYRHFDTATLAKAVAAIPIPRLSPP